MRFRTLIELLFPPRWSERVLSDIEDLPARITPTVIERSGENIVALLPYRDPLVRAAVIEAKYHGNEKAFTALGLVLAEYLREFVADEDAFSLVPVPLSKERRTSRGYNQAERIVEAALRHLEIEGAPSSHLLARTRDTKPQTKLSRRERASNLHGAFVAEGLDPAHTYVVVDDVVTTGATLQEAAKALRERGASRVICIALAH